MNFQISRVASCALPRVFRFLLLTSLIAVAFSVRADEFEDCLKKLNYRYDPYVQHPEHVQAAEALGKLKDPRAIGPLINCLKYNDKALRDAASRALTEINDPRAVDPLIACLKDKNEYVRAEAAWVLGGLKDPRAVVPLMNCLNDQDGLVRTLVIMALGKLKDPRAIGPLMACLKDQDKLVREKAAEVLGDYEDPRSVEPFINCLKDNNPRTRTIAATVLGNLKDPRAVEPLIAYLKDEQQAVRRRTKWEDFQLVFDPYSGRKIAAEALGKLGDKRAIEPLRLCLPDWEGTRYIRAALDKLGFDWHPKSEQEQIYFWFCKNNGKEIKQHSTQTIQILSADLESADRLKRENAAGSFADKPFLLVGNAEIIAKMVELLEREGTYSLAYTFLNSGNNELRKAAENWAGSHGYKVNTFRLY
ncbi:MAG: hypothetical protein PCFJNLEI_01356 [Verrucomicrobiae bacterium]|nr:hypothetical protein [Verrucomicrobiae bacterium]